MTHRKAPVKPTTILAATTVVAALAVAPGTAQAHVSFHPNAIPQGSFVTTNVRVPNEETKATISSVRIKMPDGVLSAQGQPPAGWKFAAKTTKLAKPVKTDDGTISTQVTEVDFTGGDTPPGEFVNLPLTLSIPDSAKQGDVVAFPTVQTYSDGHKARWIGAPDAELPSPTIDITAPGAATLDVTGGDAGPPAKLPANLTGVTAAAPAASPTAAPAATRTVVRKEQASKTLSVIALIVGAAGLAVGGAALTRRRQTA